MGLLENGPMQWSFRWPTLQSLAPEWYFSVRVHYCSICSSIFYICHSMALCYTSLSIHSWTAYPAVFRWEVGYTLDKLPAHQGQQTDPFTLTFTPEVNVESLVHLSPKCLWIVGGCQSTRRKLTQTWGEHENSTQKSPWPPGDSNLFAVKQQHHHHHHDTPNAGRYLEIYSLLEDIDFSFDTCGLKGGYKMFFLFMLN